MKRLSLAALIIFCAFALVQAAQDTFKQSPYTGKPDNIGQFDKYSSGLNKVGREFKNFTALATYSTNGRMSKEDKRKAQRTILLSEYVTGSGDETTGVQAAFDALRDGYQLVFDLDFETKSVVYFPTNATTFKISGSGHVWKNYSSSALMTRAPFATYSGLSVTMTQGVDSFTVPGGVSLSVGDFVAMKSSTPWITNYYPGSIARIYELSGGKAYLDVAPYTTFTADIIEVSKGYENVEIDGIVFDQSGQTNNTGNRTLELYGVTGAEIHHNEFSGSDNMLLGTNIIGNNVKLYNNLSEGYLDLLSASRTGYCFSVGGSNLIVENNIAINCKHDITVGHRRWQDNNVTIRNNYLYQDPAFASDLDPNGAPVFWSVADSHANVGRIEWLGNYILGVAAGSNAMVNVRNGRTIFDNNTVQQVGGDSTTVFRLFDAPLEYLKIHGGEITMTASSELLSNSTYYPVTNISGTKTTNVKWDGTTISNLYNMPQFITVAEATKRIGINATPLASLSIASTATTGNALELVKDSAVTENHPSIATYKNNDLTNGNAAVFTFGSKNSATNSSYVGAQIGALFTNHNNDAARNTDFIVKTQKGTADATTKLTVTGDGNTIVTGYIEPANGVKFSDGIQTQKAAPSTGSANTAAFANGLGGFTHANSIYKATDGADTVFHADNFYTGTIPSGPNLNAAYNTANTANSTASTVNTRIPAPGGAGQIPFGVAGTPNTYTTDGSLNWDNTNKRLGVGTSLPSHGVHIAGSGVLGNIKVVDNATAYGSSSGAVAFLAADNGTAISAANTRLGSLIFQGARDASGNLNSGAEVGAFSSGAFSSSTVMPSYLWFRVAGASGARNEKLRIDGSGLITMSNGGGVPFGSMYTDTALTITVSSAGVWYEVNTGATDFTAGLLKNVTQSDHYMVATTAGYYEVEACASLGTGVAGHKVALTTAVNGTATSYGHGHTTIANAASTSQVCIVNVLSLTAGQEVSLMVQNHSGGVNIDIDHAQAKMKYIGSP